MANITVTAANVLAGSDAIIGTGTAGATITAGQAVYKDTATSKYLLCDAAAAATAKAAGIALNTVFDTQPIDFIKQGDLNPGGAVIVGQVYMVSQTAGGIAQILDLTDGDFPTVLGIGTTVTNVKIKIVEGGVAASGVDY